MITERSTRKLQAAVNIHRDKQSSLRKIDSKFRKVRISPQTGTCWTVVPATKVILSG